MVRILRRIESLEQALLPTETLPPPTARVPRLEYHHGRIDHRLLRAPIKTNVRLVAAEATQKGLGRPATNGKRGTRPQRGMGVYRAKPHTFKGQRQPGR
jgi:hypothetical protein